MLMGLKTRIIYVEFFSFCFFLDVNFSRELLRKKKFKKGNFKITTKTK